MTKERKVPDVSPLRSYQENVGIILLQKLEDVYKWEPFLRDETRREELHNMRISIKRLRYTMEIFRGTYELPPPDNQYAEFLAVIVDLQEILGDIHDADVVLEVLGDYTSQSRNRRRQIDVPPGIATLVARTKETRKADYETFLGKWDQLSAAGFKQKLLSLFGATCELKTC